MQRSQPFSVEELPQNLARAGAAVFGGRGLQRLCALEKDALPQWFLQDDVHHGVRGHDRRHVKLGFARVF